MYVVEQNQLVEDDFELPGPCGNTDWLFHKRIAEIEQTVELMRHESLQLNSSRENLVNKLATLKEFQSRIIKDNTDQGDSRIDNTEFGHFIAFALSQNDDLQSELVNLSHDLHSTELIQTHYEDAIFLLRVRQEVSRMRSSLRFTHPCGDILLFSPFIHRLNSISGKQGDGGRQSSPKHGKKTNQGNTNPTWRRCNK